MEVGDGDGDNDDEGEGIRATLANHGYGVEQANRKNASAQLERKTSTKTIRSHPLGTPRQRLPFPRLSQQHFCRPPTCHTSATLYATRLRAGQPREKERKRDGPMTSREIALPELLPRGLPRVSLKKQPDGQVSERLLSRGRARFEVG